jgi:hypothetical protein
VVPKCRMCGQADETVEHLLHAHFDDIVDVTVTNEFASL